MVLYNISFTFTNPSNLEDVNNMKHLKDLTKDEKDAWIKDIFLTALKGSWLISHLTIKKYTS